MKKYIVFGFTDKDTVDMTMEPNQNERQEIFMKWKEWEQEFGDFLVSMGSPLINGTVIGKDGIKEGKVSDLAGYMIIKAEDEDHAYELLSKSPLFGMGHGQRYELFECVM